MERNGGAILRSACRTGMVGIGAALLLLFFCALLSNRMILPEGREGVCGRAALFLAAVLTGYLGARRQKSGKLPYGFAGGAVLLLGVIILAVSEKKFVSIQYFVALRFYLHYIWYFGRLLFDHAAAAKETEEINRVITNCYIL